MTAHDDTSEDPARSWASSPGVRRSMRSNRGRDTGPELRLRRALHGRGHRYFVDKAPLKGLRRRADLLFPRKKVAVFVDGCFWHGCPDHHTVSKTNAGYWAAKVEANRARDLETDRLLTEAGWTVVRIWEHEPVETAVTEVEKVLLEEPRTENDPT